jgi:type III secretion protein J
MQNALHKVCKFGGNRLRLLALAPVLLLLVACNEQTLYSDLPEQEANDMVALLYTAGLPATKTLTGDRRFSVSTSQKEFSQAVGLLHGNGFPRAQFDNIGKVFAREGFVSSPLEERARLNYAQSQELSQTLSSIDGVVGVRVHLAVPEYDALKVDHPQSSASVLV